MSADRPRPDGPDSSDAKDAAVWLRVFQTSPDHERRFQALVTLSRLLSPADYRPQLLHGLDDADAGVQAFAAKQLGVQFSAAGVAVDQEQVFGELFPLLAHPDPDVRFEAARALARLGSRDASVVEALEPLLLEPETHPTLQASILEVLAEFAGHSERLIPTVRPFLASPSEQVREATLDVLTALAPHPQIAAGEFLPLLDDDDPYVREKAAVLLGTIGDRSPEVTAALQTAAEDEDEAVAAAAKRALGKS